MIIANANHECIGDDCPICMLIHNAKTLSNSGFAHGLKKELEKDVTEGGRATVGQCTNLIAVIICANAQSVLLFDALYVTL